jgi:prevent-host-death family protein
MQSINIHDAKTNLSKLLELVSNGEKFIIAKAGKPIAMLSPIETIKAKPKFGVLKGKIKIAADFDAPLPNDLLDRFEGK